jgi:hypothetical protein
MLTVLLTSCGRDVPRPTIKEGRFNISVTYEQDGETKTVSGVYVCEYDGIVWWTINSDPYVNWKTRLEGELNTESIPVCTTDDGGEIFITMFLYPEYFMGDPELAHFEPMVRAELFYEDRQIDDTEIIAEYGVKLIKFEYDKPIENSFKP